MREKVPRDSKGRELLSEHQFSKHRQHVVERFQYMLDHKVRKKDDLPEHMRTRKFSQKPLPKKWKSKPTMTVTSLPDDYVHYSSPRTFSVREWARLQTFPDHHVFCGKRTTGGDRRAGNPSKGNWDREVPKYTQIGNAVPPLLAQAIGDHIIRLMALNEFDPAKKSETGTNDERFREIASEIISEKTQKSNFKKIFEAAKTAESLGKWLKKITKSNLFRLAFFA